MAEGRMKVIRGEDYVMTLKVRDKTANNPVDLTNVTKISIDFTRSNRSILTLTNQIRPAERASVKIQTTVIRAVDPGNAGNSISFEFNSSLTIKQVVDAWNLANPSALVEVIGDDTVKPVTGIYRLDGGFDSYYPLQIQGSPLLGRVSVRLNDFDTRGLRLGLNQSLVVKIDIGPYPSGDRILAKFENKFDVID